MRLSGNIVPRLPILLCAVDLVLAVTTTSGVSTRTTCTTRSKSFGKTGLRTETYRESSTYTSTITPTTYIGSTITPDPYSATQTVVTTVSGRGGTQTVTSPITSLRTLRESTTSTSYSYVYTTSYTSGRGDTVSIATPAGFTPFASVIGNGAPHQPSVDVWCAYTVVDYHRITVDSTVSITFADTASQPTTTWTTTSTSFVANPPTATVTAFSGTHTATTTITDTFPASTTITVTVTKNTGLPPTTTKYAACDANNLVSTINGAILWTPSHIEALNATGAYGENCCAACQQQPDCGGFMVRTGFCILFKGASPCNGAVRRWGFLTNETATVGWTIGNGQCGQGQYDGSV